MPFTVQPCVPADAFGLAACMMGARLTDPHWVLLWEDPCPEDIIHRSAERMPWNLVTSRETKRHLKVVEVESGQVVGYARWILPPVLASKNDVWLEAQVAEVMPEELSLYEQKYQANSRNGGLIGIKSEMMEFRSRPLDEADARIMEHGPFLTMEYITTDPALWRKGIASMLVQKSLNVADKYGIKTYVISEQPRVQAGRNGDGRLLPAWRNRAYGGAFSSARASFCTLIAVMFFCF